MAIDWKGYIASTVNGLARFVAGNLTTRPVSAERMASTGLILPLLGKSAKHSHYVSGDRALVFLRAEEKIHAVAFFSASIDSTVRTKIKSRIAEFRAYPQLKETSAHYFYLLKNIHLEAFLPGGTLPEDSLLVQSLEGEVAKDGPTHSVDFDRACQAYGDVAVWELEVFDDIKPVLEVVLSAESGDKAVDLTPAANLVDTFRNHFGAENVVDLFRMFSALLGPIEQALNRRMSTARIMVPDLQGLSEALDIEVLTDSVAFGVGGGACFHFTHQERTYLAVSVRGLRDWERQEVPGRLEQMGAIREEYSPAHLLAFMYQLEGAMQLHETQSSSDQRLENNVASDEKGSIEFEQLIQVFERMAIFDVSNAPELNPAKVLAILAVNFKSARGAFVSSTIADIAKRLINIHEAPSENIYLSLSASHWKHCFIEAYRIIEGLYYFGWMHRLRSTLGSNLTEFELFNRCQVTMSWKYTEDSSIKELFSLVPLEVLRSADVHTIPCLKNRFSDVGKKDPELMRSMAATIYSIRNANIHQGELEADNTIILTANCWSRLTLCLYLIIEFFYENHRAGMPTGPLIKLSNNLPTGQS